MTPRLTKAQKVARADLEWLLANAQGRRFLARLLDLTGALREVPAGDPARTMWHVGRHSIGAAILHELAADWPERLAAVLTERTTQDSDDGIDPLSDDGASRTG